MRAEHDVDPRRPPQHRVAVLLRQAAADGDLHAWVTVLRGGEVAEVPVELVVGVLPHGACVEHHHVGVGAAGGLDVPGRFQQSGETLGVVHVHLAAVRADLVGPGCHQRPSHVPMVRRG